MGCEGLMPTVAFPRPGTPSQVRQVTAALRAAVADLRPSGGLHHLPLTLSFFAMERYGGPKPHITAATINHAGERLARELGYPVRVVGEKNARKVVLG